MSNRVVEFKIGNTYRSIPESEAKFDRSGRFKKTHEWILYVSVQHGNVDLIDKVVFDLGSTFSPPQFTCTCPVPDTILGGWRFTTKQQSFSLPLPAKITLHGAGGTKLETTYTIQPETKTQGLPTRNFVENKPLRKSAFLKYAEQQKFGIELELSSAVGVSPQDIAETISSRSNVGDVVVVDSYSLGRETISQWKLVPDGSIMCSPSLPDCNKFELVSPVLQGGNGLSQVNQVLRALESVQLKVNKSMGFHVHIDVEPLSLGQLQKFCQNFVKYEDVFDSFMPPSRRTGSTESDQYFHSNRASVGLELSNKQRHERIAACGSISALVDVMNSNGNKYYKANLQNLKTGRQPTIEFRQHSATVRYDKVNAWIRFCTALVLNSARLAPPSCLSENKPLDDQFDFLFCYVVKDRKLRDFFKERQNQMMLPNGGGGEDGYCCSSCAAGHSCSIRPAAGSVKKQRH